MLSDEVIEKVVERLVRRIEIGNEYVLKKIGESIKKIGTLSPSKAQDLVQILKYGGDYDKIARKLAKITELNVKDIKKIFQEVAKNDYDFAEQFYKYRNKKYIPFDENIALKQQVNAIANATANEYINLTQTSAVAYGMQDKNGTITYKGLRQTYYDLLDEAVLNVGQGKETFDSALYRQLKEIGGGGIKVIFPTTYWSKDENDKPVLKNRVMRADSAIRMQMKSALRDMHNNIQEQIGNEFDADGVEISVHLNPAPDHEKVQGRQFTTNQYDSEGNLIKKGEFEKFQDSENAVSYDGMEFPKVSEETGYDRRSISQYNCYHYTFAIVLGVNKPQYSNEELQEIIDDNNKGFELDGKHYTMYEGTQLQRKIETEIRKAKDSQILGRASDNKELIRESQERITQLSTKYKQLSEVSGLPTKANRMRVSGYHRVKTVENHHLGGNGKQKVRGLLTPIPNIKSKNAMEKEYNEIKVKLEEKNIKVDPSLDTLDLRLRYKNLKHLDYLSDKYNVADRMSLEIGIDEQRKNRIGTTYYGSNKMQLNPNYFDNEDKLINVEKRSQEYNWHNKVKEENLDLYTVTHEYGHTIENNYARKYIKKHHSIDTDKKRSVYYKKEDDIRKEIDKDIRDSLFKEIRKSEDLTITEIKNKYFSNYGKSRTHYEWFAETFAQMILGDETPLTRALKEWLERNY